MTRPPTPVTYFWNEIKLAIDDVSLQVVHTQAWDTSLSFLETLECLVLNYQRWSKHDKGVLFAAEFSVYRVRWEVSLCRLSPSLLWRGCKRQFLGRVALLLSVIVTVFSPPSLKQKTGLARVEQLFGGSLLQSRWPTDRRPFPEQDRFLPPWNAFNYIVLG